MSSTASLQTLESVLEKFLERVVNLKEKKLSVLEGINSLDDISRMSEKGFDITDDIGGWFARHNRWLTERTLQDNELNRITNMLAQIKSELETDTEKSPAKRKIETEINRWNQTQPKTPQKMTLKRAPESTQNDSEESKADTISLFIKKLSKLTAVFMDHTGSKQHILSVLDELLQSASTQTNKDALILSAFIIYYLKQNGYKVEPYVKKLKEAEALYKRGMFNA